MTAHSIGTSGFPFSFRLDNEMEVPEAPVDSGLIERSGDTVWQRSRSLCTATLVVCEVVCRSWYLNISAKSSH